MSDPVEVKEVLDTKSEKLKKVSELTCDKCGSNGHKTEDHGKNGGARSGAGREPGKPNSNTVEIRAAKKKFQERVAQMADRLLNSQANKALGETMLFVTYDVGTGKDKRRVTERIEDEETIIRYLDGELDGTNDNNEYYFITTKPASTQAADSLLNRAFGKATEKIEIEGGFFKADKLTIQIINPETVHGPSDNREAIDVTPSSDGENPPTEPEAEPSVSAS